MHYSLYLFLIPSSICLGPMGFSLDRASHCVFFFFFLMIRPPPTSPLFPHPPLFRSLRTLSCSLPAPPPIPRHISSRDRRGGWTTPSAATRGEPFRSDQSTSSSRIRRREERQRI